MTFGQTFTRCFRHLCIWVGIIAMLMAFGAMTQEKESVSREHAAQSPDVVMASCDAPATGDYPRAVIMQRANSGAVISSNVKHIDKGINEVMGVKEWNNVRVVGFCR